MFGVFNYIIFFLPTVAVVIFRKKKYYKYYKHWSKILLDDGIRLNVFLFYSVQIILAIMSQTKATKAKLMVYDNAI